MEFPGRDIKLVRDKFDRSKSYKSLSVQFEHLNIFYWLITLNEVLLFFWCKTSRSAFTLKVLM